MPTVDTNDLLDYLSCSWKASFPKRERVFNSYQNIKSRLYRQLFEICLIYKITDNNLSIYKLNEVLNSTWASIKPDILCTTSLSLKLGIKSKLNYFLDTFNSISKVHYFNVPRTVQVLNSTILYSFSTVEYRGKVRSIVALNNQFINMSQDSYAISILGGLLQDSLNTLKDDLRHDLMFFRSDTGDLLEVAYNPEYKVAIKNLIQSLESEIYYPRNEYLICNSCQYNKECTWSSY
jgi:hypothetical protein